MSVPELTPVETPIFDDLVIEQMQEHLDDELRCGNCDTAASARLVASCCKTTAMKCTAHLDMWVQGMVRLMPCRTTCVHCGDSRITFTIEDVCLVVPL